nr:15506_t:CDS:2 [Entrophospora candida]
MKRKFEINSIINGNNNMKIEEQMEPTTVDDKSVTDNTVVGDEGSSPENEEQGFAVNEEFNGGQDPNEEQKEDHVKTFLKQWHVEAPDLCCVCLEGATDVKNKLVYCCGWKCEVICHQECYGIIKLPVGDHWYCDKCLAKPAEVVEENGLKTNPWVHLVCALWTPGMSIANPQGLDECSISNTEKINWKKECCICPKELASQGVPLHCDAYQCRNWIHVTCAQAYNLLKYVEDSEIDDPFFVLCNDHSLQPGSLCLNEWERWILKRDEFLDRVRSRELQKETCQLAGGNDDWLIDYGKILQEMFEDVYVEHQKCREKQIIQLRMSIAQLNSSYKQNKYNMDKAKEEIKLLYQNVLIAKTETVEIVRYLKLLKFRVKTFVEKMIKKDIESINIIGDNSHNNNSRTNTIHDNIFEMNQYAFIEYPTYKEAKHKISNGLLIKTIIKIQKLLVKLPKSISDWDNNGVKKAKSINVKGLHNFEEIILLRLNKAQKIFDQRKKEVSRKSASTFPIDDNCESGLTYGSNNESSNKDFGTAINIDNDNIKNIQQQAQSSSSTVTNSNPLQLIENLTNQLKKEYYTGKVPCPAARMGIVSSATSSRFGKTLLSSTLMLRKKNDRENKDKNSNEDDNEEDEDDNIKVYENECNDEDDKDYKSFDSDNSL